MSRHNDDFHERICELAALHQALGAIVMDAGWAADPDKAAAVKGLIEVMSGPVGVLEAMVKHEADASIAAAKAALASEASKRENAADPPPDQELGRCDSTT